jgi:hypothetical protein
MAAAAVEKRPASDKITARPSRKDRSVNGIGEASPPVAARWAHPSAGRLDTESALASRLTRRALVGGLALALVGSWRNRAEADPSADTPKVIEFSPENKRLLYEEIASKVVPESGYESRIALRDSIVRLVRHGVIDLGKFFALQREGVRIPGDLSHVLSEPSDEPIRLTRENAGVYVNLLWGVGLANRIAGNFSSPLSGSALPTFASTAGWTLGDRDEGADYFNKFQIVGMTQSQESAAIRVAKSTFRPCCDNSTFYQDCNHGSALYGLLQLGASQGLRDKDLYQEALAFNSFWFEDHYVRTALYFAVARGVAWRDVDPTQVMGREYSSLSSWRMIVQAWVDRNPDLIPDDPGLIPHKPDLIPQPQRNAKCGA